MASRLTITSFTVSACVPCSERRSTFGFSPRPHRRVLGRRSRRRRFGLTETRLAGDQRGRNPVLRSARTPARRQPPARRWAATGLGVAQMQPCLDRTTRQLGVPRIPTRAVAARARRHKIRQAVRTPLRHRTDVIRDPGDATTPPTPVVRRPEDLVAQRGPHRPVIPAAHLTLRRES
jgi:hypothetical protein